MKPLSWRQERGLSILKKLHVSTFFAGNFYYTEELLFYYWFVLLSNFAPEVYFENADI